MDLHREVAMFHQGRIGARACQRIGRETFNGFVQWFGASPRARIAPRAPRSAAQSVRRRRMLGYYGSTLDSCFASWMRCGVCLRQHDARCDATRPPLVGYRYSCLELFSKIPSRPRQRACGLQHTQRGLGSGRGGRRAWIDYIDR